MGQTKVWEEVVVKALSVPTCQDAFINYALSI